MQGQTVVAAHPKLRSSGHCTCAPPLEGLRGRVPGGMWTMCVLCSMVALTTPSICNGKIRQYLLFTTRNMGRAGKILRAVKRSIVINLIQPPLERCLIVVEMLFLIGYAVHFYWKEIVISIICVSAVVFVGVLIAINFFTKP